MVGESLMRGLRDAGYAVDWARDGQSASTALADEHNHYLLALLDWGLPKQDGLSVLKRLRDSGSELPILMITARDEVEDRVIGLDHGADDYLVKPFALAELMARIRSVLRRKEGRARNLIEYRDLVIDPVEKTVTLRGELVPLTMQEYKVLFALIEYPGMLLSREQLQQRLYGWDQEIDSNVIPVVVHRVRRKLGDNFIENVRTFGWRIPRLS
ncbi:MAG: response regulator [Nevskia sp.]|nr:response regulator [Nevskia sp.]